MTSVEIRDKFLRFFETKRHAIVPSAPLVLKNDPTLMFTNAGMNQFKDYFLGNKEPQHVRVADTQKCLRVSGKHNDLEEVGIDSYHHTMFEMLGNWSFGDYFKKEAIYWSWELLTEEFTLPKDRLFATVFGGDQNDSLAADVDAEQLWKELLPAERVLRFGKKDNFWEMGDTGPCGPCSEIHIDLRDESERRTTSAVELVNMDHPEVIEIWNLVFIQFDRKADASLHHLPAKHIDTGMGFERLCMVVQGKKSSYDSDIFTPLIDFIAKSSGITYSGSYARSAKSDIAMRVVADHVRALFFGILDGQLPSNTGAGYVLRRILRRTVRYYYSFLNIKVPFIHSIVPILVDYFAEVFEGVQEQADFVAQVIEEEERSFLRTLESGLKRFESLDTADGQISGEDAFELYDTYGFPIDLTRLIASEKSLSLDEKAFEEALEAQKARSRADATKEVGDWIVVAEGNSAFDGYDNLEIRDVRVLRHRTLEAKGNTQYHLVLDRTPFYAKGGGQVGDTGSLTGPEDIAVLDTLKENDLTIHVVDRLPADARATFTAQVNRNKRKNIENNHTATHLLHAALREVLGTHVQQRGSLVDDQHLRFDFSHFQKVTDDEITQVEDVVNQRIRQNITRGEARNVLIDEAKQAGAMMLFGEQYGNMVRMITFDPDFSVELCGGCHVEATGQIGTFRIVSESAVAAGVRRIEAVTAGAAQKYVNDQLAELGQIRTTLRSAGDAARAVEVLLADNKALKKKLQELQLASASNLQKELEAQFATVGNIELLATEIQGVDGKAAKAIVYNLIKAGDKRMVVIGGGNGGRVQLHVGLSQALVDSTELRAGDLIKQLAQHIKGGGGGQPTYASAGGKDLSGLPSALEAARKMAAAV